MNSPTTGNDILSFIRCNCKHLLGSKFWQVRFVCKVDAGWKSEKLECKYMVLSKFRLFFLSGKTASKLLVDSSFNVLSIGEIGAAHEHELLLSLDGRKLHLRLTESSLSAMDVARKLLQAFKNYFPSCDPFRFMHLEPSSLYALFAVLPRSRPSLSCDGFRRTYAALCDFYKLPFRDEVVWDIEKIYTLQSSSILRLDDFSHLYAKDLIPVIASLQFTAWFNGISAETFKLVGEVVEIILTVIKKSKHLKTLILRNCGLKNDFLQQFASALNANPTIPLDTIDFSGNTFDEGKAVYQFASALSNLSIGCRYLILSDCGLHAKSVNALCTALQQNQKQAGSKTLTLVSFAKNVLKSDVAELHHLLSSTTLETLDISGTGISLEGVLFSMKASNERISTLLLSGCSFPERKGKDLASSNSVKDFFANAVALTNVDLSDCALPSDVLKFVLLGIVCNQKVNYMRLDLSRSFADRQCISMLETCAPNLASVSDLILRDIRDLRSFSSSGFQNTTEPMYLEQEALSLIRALPLMPNLRRLDIGGNNFNVIRKQQPKILVNIMLEVAKLINDEDGSLRELVLSDCHLGVSLSVLLNALGVAPSLISLDISGNDFGNPGARLLAKALQLNAVLETLSIDRNTISYDGYSDILHALKGNSTLRCIPYPLHDACELLKWNREKTDSVLSEIERSLQRNACRSSPRDVTLSTEAHSRLMLTNVDDEVNKAVYSAEHLLAESKCKDGDHPGIAHVRTLLDDAEKAKKLLDDMALLTCNSEFVDDFVEQFLNQYTSKFEETMKICSMQFSEIPADKDITVCTDKDFLSALRESSSQKTRSFASALRPVFADLQEKLRQHFKQATFALACGAVEKVEQELLRSLQAANKNLDETQNSASIHSTGSMSSALPIFSSSSGTPKGKRKKFRLFARSTRPKSIIESDGILDNTDDTMEDVALAGTPGDSCGDSLDSESFEVLEKPMGVNDESADEVPKLMHIVKDRPRLPYQRRQRATVSSEKYPKDSDYSAGVDSFFGGSKNEAPTDHSSRTNNAKEDHEPAPAVEVLSKRVSRLPPNAVPLLSADLLHDRGAVGKAHLAPRPPPNTLSSGAKPRDENGQSTSVNSPVTNEQDSAGLRSPKRLSMAPDMCSVSFANDKPTAGHAASANRVVQQSPTKTQAHDGTRTSDSTPSPQLEDQSTRPKDSPDEKADPSSPVQPSSPPRQDNAAGRSVEAARTGMSLEENNNASADAVHATAGAKGASTPPPRPPPPPSSKMAKMRQPEVTQSADVSEPVLRNKAIDAATAQSQAAQRKSVMDLTAMFESKPPPPARPVPPPRPNKKLPAAT